MLRAIAVIVFSALVASCSSSTQQLQEQADALAHSVGLRKIQLQAGDFTLMAYERMGSISAPVHIYIEGDGNAWTGSSLSSDPTPSDPVALRLAAADNSPNVVYLARVCQYVMSPSCNSQYWSNAQFGETVMDAYHQALQRWKTYHLELNGYSGGAAVALLLAARRDDVVAIRTIAGNVDTDAFTILHHLSPLSASMNPAVMIERTSRIPQRHFAGEHDTVVPPMLIAAYQARMPAGHCSAYNVVPAIDHYKGWPEVWPVLLAQPLPCAPEQ